MRIPTYIIDTFTSAPFKGNPAGICYTNKEIDAHTMLSIAKELNLPVNAFIKKRNNITHEYDIRYFTSITEISACGHATLAAAKATFEKYSCNTATFYTVNNINIEVFTEKDYIVMTYPKYELESYTVNKEILNNLTITQYKSAGYCTPLETLFIELENPDILTSIQPDYIKLLNSSNNIKEIVVTSISNNKNYDYLLRSFCPWIGIDEDPVTGSVHSVLAGFWKKRLNKNILKVYQASERGGELLVKAYEDKVEIGGRAIIIFKGDISL